MTDWQAVWLATIALALVVMAAIQVAAITAVMRVVRESLRVIERVERDLTPLLVKAHRIADDAARTTALAAVQAERIDALVSSATERIDGTLEIVQRAIVDPIRQGTAFVAGLRAVIAALRGWRSRESTSSEEDDALFIG